LHSLEKVIKIIEWSITYQNRGCKMEDIIYTIIWLIIAGIIVFIFKLILFPSTKQLESRERRRKANQEYIHSQEKKLLLAKIGPISPQYICPHCQTKGSVHTIPVKRKKGVSGAKVTAGLITLGASVLVTGLSRKEGLTQAHCENCNSTWDF
jgi:hypothetical protein